MEGKCKIRKRGCSSSSSSSLARRYRLKRAILVGRKTGSTTPVPAWKPPCSGPTSPPPPREPGGKGLPVSARKLGATLWEINEVTRDVNEEEEEEEVVDDEGSGEGTRRLSGRSGQLVPHLADDLSQSAVLEVVLFQCISNGFSVSMQQLFLRQFRASADKEGSSEKELLQSQ